MIKKINRAVTYGLAALLTVAIGCGSHLTNRDATRMLAQVTPIEMRYFEAQKATSQSISDYNSRVKERSQAMTDWRSAWIDPLGGTIYYPGGLRFGEPNQNENELARHDEVRTNYYQPYLKAIRAAEEKVAVAEKDAENILASAEMQNVLKNKRDARTRKDVADTFSYLSAFALGGLAASYIRRKKP